MSVSSRALSSASFVEAAFVPISTQVPPEVVDRLRAAALQIGIRQEDIIAVALDSFLEEEGL
jgi:hypothetical protein